MKNYDVIIIGAGPAGIFAALEMAETGLKVLILEKGRDISARACPIHTRGTKCLHCKPCGILCGWGGAGAYSDGKLTLTTEFGGMLDQYMEKPALLSMVAASAAAGAGITEASASARAEAAQIIVTSTAAFKKSDQVTLSGVASAGFACAWADAATGRCTFSASLACGVRAAIW